MPDLSSKAGLNNSEIILPFAVFRLSIRHASCGMRRFNPQSVCDMSHIITYNLQGRLIAVSQTPEQTFIPRGWPCLEVGCVCSPLSS